MDLNRSGVGLMEIVSKPDIRSSEEAKAYISKLRTIMRYLGTCDGNMEEGSLRADVNVSVRKPGEKLGTRCEIKNMNSLRFIGQAIEYEARRQIDVLEDGGTIHQNTLLYDPKTGKTAPMRSKEEAHDYRYFPDPDLLPLVLAETFVEKLRKALPELPDEKRARFIKDYGLSAYDAGVLIADRASADFFEAVAKGRDAKLAANWIMGDFFAALNKTGRDISDSPVSAQHLGELIGLISSNVISGRIAKEVFEIMLADRGRAREDRRGARAEAGHRYRRHREGRGRDHRGEPEAGGAGAGQAQDARLVRGPGDEGHGREGEPRCGQRHPPAEAQCAGGGLKPVLCLW